MRNVRTFKEFANIAHKKAANDDAAKGKIFTRLGKEIMVAVKEGGPEVNNNSKLRQVVTKAKAANMPNDTIERAIKKAASTDMSNFESVTYEGYEVTIVQLLLLKHTDNRNNKQPTFVTHLQRAAEMSEHRVAYPLCLTIRDRLSLGKKTVIKMPMN